MGDRADPDPLQEILDELDSIRARKMELLVQVSAILREIIGDVPPRPTIRLTLRGPREPSHPRRCYRLPPEPVPEEREFVLDSIGNRLQLGDCVCFTGTARTRASTGRVTGWTGHIEVPGPFIYIERDVPPGVRYVGSRIVHRKSHNVTLTDKVLKPLRSPPVLRFKFVSPLNLTSSLAHSLILP